MARTNTTISNSYATGSVKGSWNVGGLVGHATSGTIENSYSTGEVTGSGDYVGGFMGHAYESTISNSYWDTETTRQEESAGGGEGKSNDEMKLKTTYEDWDFEKVWEIQEGASYPTLINNPERH